MTSLVAQLTEKGLIHPRPWLPQSIHYETIMGSYAYGVSQDTSDNDVYGFCVPPIEIVFPHVKGIIKGFGDQGEIFDQFQEHHVKDEEDAKEYDLSIYNIVKYFQLCMGCNPNMIDSLFTPKEAIITQSKVAELVRENRKLFLSKRAWGTFRGYAYSQIQKLGNKRPTGHRMHLVERFGYDVKYAYHLVRLLDEAEQILKDGDIDITRDHVRLRDIRNGKWTENQVIDFFKAKSNELDKVYESSTLQDEPDETLIRNLLVCCLEEAYGSLDKILGRAPER